MRGQTHPCLPTLLLLFRDMVVAINAVCSLCAFLPYVFASLSEGLLVVFSGVVLLRSGGRGDSFGQEQLGLTGLPHQLGNYPPIGFHSSLVFCCWSISVVCREGSQVLGEVLI